MGGRLLTILDEDEDEVENEEVADAKDEMDGLRLDAADSDAGDEEGVEIGWLVVFLGKLGHARGQGSPWMRRRPGWEQVWRGVVLKHILFLVLVVGGFWYGVLVFSDKETVGIDVGTGRKLNGGRRMRGTAFFLSWYVWRR